MEATRYSPADRSEWDGFVRDSKNGTFLFFRDYMDYHADRFRDHSLIVRDEKGKLAGLLPANETAQGLASHGGLTYGGVISDKGMTAGRMLRVFDALKAYMRVAGMEKLAYKAIPSIYHRFPAEEDLYALFRNDARLWRRDVLSVIASHARLPFDRHRLQPIATARRHGLVTRESDDFRGFCEMLADGLRQAHDVAPVHSHEELRLLHARLPDYIRLHLCFEGDNIVAGVLMFDTECVAHAQYGIATQRGRKIGGLDYLLAELINETYAHRRFFDFGNSNEQDGRDLNLGLARQKEGFGGRTVVQDFYELSTS